MTRTIAAILLAATTAIAAALPAHAGGVLLCNEYGCRSSPYFPPPIIAMFPPVVYMPPNPPVRPPPPPAYTGLPQARNAPASPPRTAPPATAEENEIEGDILAFCRNHADEPFCGKLHGYLERTGRARK
jgi:hypothetical protein